MDPMSLLPTQRNDIFEACARGGWDPRRFSWGRRGSLYSRGNQIDSLELTGTDFFFAFDHGAEEATPEPSSAVLLSVGLACMSVARRRLLGS
jgi:hypothetical protein